MAGLTFSSDHAVKTIVALLQDDYQKNHGRTIVRELVQNADDARATSITFMRLDDGLPGGTNPLLTGPGLVVVNDGPFSESNKNGLHTALGGDKVDDVTKVGRFGLGLKSVFHYCEAFLYFGRGRDGDQFGVVNPWDWPGVGDRVYPEWSAFANEDRRALANCMVLSGLPANSDGLVIYLPLRRAAHCNRGKKLADWQVDGRAADIDVHEAGLFSGHDDGRIEQNMRAFAMWLAQAHSVTRIVGLRGSLSGNSSSAGLAEVYSGELAVVQGRRLARPAWPEPDEPAATEPFRASVSLRAHGKRFAEVEVFGVQRLDGTGGGPVRKVYDGDGFPNDETLDAATGIYSPARRKCAPHGAITLLASTLGGSGAPEVNARWAVFLPLDERADEVRKTSVAPAVVVDLLLHGYFFPSKDRKTIPGVTAGANSAAEQDDRARVSWNQVVRDRLVLPILPGVLAAYFAAGKVAPAAFSEMLRTLAVREELRGNDKRIQAEQWLVPLVETGWRAVDVSDVPHLRTVRGWLSLSPSQRGVWRTFNAVGLRLVDGEAYAGPNTFGGGVPPWTCAEATQLVTQLAELRRTAPAGANADGALVVADAEVQSVLACLPAQRWPADLRQAVLSWAWGLVAAGHGPFAKGAGDELKETDESKKLRPHWRDLQARLCRSGVAVVEIRAGGQLAVQDLARSAIPYLWLSQWAGTPLTPPAETERQLAVDLLANLLSREPGLGGKRAQLALAKDLLKFAGPGLAERDPRLKNLPFIPCWRLSKADSGTGTVTPTELARLKGEGRVLGASGGDDDEPEVHRFVAADARSLQRKVLISLKQLLAPVGDVADVVVVPTGFASGAPSWHQASVNVMSADLLLRNKGAVNLSGEPARELFLAWAGSPELAKSEKVRAAARILAAGDARAQSSSMKLLRFEREAVPEEVVHGWVHATKQEVLSVESWVAQASAEALDSIDIVVLKKADLISKVRGLPPESMKRLAGDEGSRQAVVSFLVKESAQGLDKIPLHWTRDGRCVQLSPDRARRVAGVDVPRKLVGDFDVIAEGFDAATQDYYRNHVAVLDAATLVERILAGEDPSKDWTLVINLATERVEGRLCWSNAVLGRLGKELRQRTWVPVAGGRGVAPGRILCCAEPVAGDLERLATAVPGAGWALARSIAAEFAETATDLFERLGLPQWPQVVCDGVTGLGSRWTPPTEFCLLPDSKHLTSDLLAQGLGLAKFSNNLAGWRIVAAAQSNDVGSKSTPSELVLELARKFCGPFSDNRQWSELLNAAAPDGQVPQPARKFWYALAKIAATSGGLRDALPRLKLPAAGGAWCDAAELTASAADDIPLNLQLDSELRKLLDLDSESSRNQIDETLSKTLERGAELTPVAFGDWLIAQLPGARETQIGAALAILGDRLRPIADRMLDPESVDVVRRHLSPAMPSPFGVFEVHVFGPSARPGCRSVPSITGRALEFQVTEAFDSILACAPVRPDPRQPDLVELHLQELPAPADEVESAGRVLYDLVDAWCDRFFRHDTRVQGNFATWWAQYGEGTQASVDPVRRRLLADMPSTLDELKVSDSPALAQVCRHREKLRDIEKEIALSDDAGNPGTAAAHRDHAGRRESEKKLAWSALAACMEASDASSALHAKVREYIAERGYKRSSVLLELIQNADDAIHQQVSVVGDLPGATTVSVTLPARAERRHLILRHKGRPINEHYGRRCPDGKRRFAWHDDLYFMLRFNVSGKREVSTDNGAPVTTGHFGLGFKSVHLVSPCPRVASAGITFEIVGGLLPRALANDDVPHSDGRDETVIDLELLPDVRDDELFERLKLAAPLIPAFSRQIEELALPAGFGGTYVHRRRPFLGLDQWSLSEPLQLPESVPRKAPDSAEWRVLRFCANTEGDDYGKLVVWLRNGVPQPTPVKDVPTLWVTMPTQDKWEFGYEFSAAMRLNSDRGRVDLDHENTRTALQFLGKALGAGLVALASAVAHADGPLPVGNADCAPNSFLMGLWRVLAGKLAQALPTERSKIAGWLHGSGAGLAVLAGADAFVASDLPDPFPQLVGPIARETDVRTASEAAELAAKKGLVSAANLLAGCKKYTVVHDKTAKVLGFVLDVKARQVKLTELLQDFTGRQTEGLDPDSAAKLEKLLDLDLWKAVAGESSSEAQEFGKWRKGLKFKGADDKWHPASELVAAVAPLDESLRAAFAPQDRVLHPDYAANGPALTVFLKLRGSLDADTQSLAAWARSLDKRRAVELIRYLVVGELRRELIGQLATSRPPCIESRAEVRALVDQLGDEADPDDRAYLDRNLFQDQYVHRDDVPQLPPDPDPDDDVVDEEDPDAGEPDEAFTTEPGRDPATVLHDLHAWWLLHRDSWLADYERRTYRNGPPAIRTAGFDARALEDRRAWLELFFTGAFQKLGRTRQEQNRDFMRHCADSGWLDLAAAGVETHADWLSSVGAHIGKFPEEIEYYHWLREFVPMYQLSRWLTDYASSFAAALRCREPYSFREVVSPRSSGRFLLDGSNPPGARAALGAGATFVMRELARLTKCDNRAVHHHAYFAPKKVREVLSGLGCYLDDKNLDFAANSVLVHDFLSKRLGPDLATFGYDFDLPLHALAYDEKVREEVGMKRTE